MFLCGKSESDSEVRLLARRFVSVPSHQYVQRLEYHLEIAPAFYNQIITLCLREHLNPVIIHSHPKNRAAFYSPSDDYGESHLLKVLEDLLPGKTVASLVTTPVEVIGRRRVKKKFKPLNTVRIVGPRITLSSPVDAKATGDARGSGEEYDRQVRCVSARRVSISFDPCALVLSDWVAPGRLLRSN